MELHCVVDSHSEVGEGAIWDERASKLWWVDIPKGHIYRFDPATGVNETFAFGMPVGCLAVRASGGLVIATKNGFWFFDPDTGTKEAIADPEAHLPLNRFNDGGPDRQGRFWAGTMQEDKPQPRTAAFYRLDADRSVTKGMEGFYTTNGMAFSPDGKCMYVADSDWSVRSIWAYDYDIDSGTPSNPRLFFDTSSLSARCDGGTVDADGCYWMAGIDGWQVVRITPEGKVDRVIELPIQRPSKPMWGGDTLDTLFVTSLGVGLQEGREQPQAGGLFAITGTGHQGLPEAYFPG